MNGERVEELVSCTDCGIELDPGLERGYVGGDWALCMSCAGKRGGTYDEGQDSWIVDPLVDDLMRSDDHAAR